MVNNSFCVQAMTGRGPDRVGTLPSVTTGSQDFTFDKVHGLPDGASNTQAAIFSEIQDIVLGTLEGLDGCIMACDQSGGAQPFQCALLPQCNGMASCRGTFCPAAPKQRHGGTL